MSPGPSTRRASPLLGLALLLVAACFATPVLATDRARSAADSVARAWAAGQAWGVTASMAPKGTVRLVLRSPRIDGTYQKAQAERALAAYFKKASRIRLKDVTPSRHRDVPCYCVRTYAYDYQPKGHDAVSALLVVTLKSGPDARYHLASIEERPRPLRTR